MKKDIFGKGEAALIDRIMEKLPVDQDRAIRPEKNNLETLTLSNTEYFYILRKIFHTFMFDMKEFAIDVYDLSVENYLSTLTWLTYVHTQIYKLDLSIEKQASHMSPDTRIDFESVRTELNSFLREHELLDAGVEKSVGRVIRYLVLEQDKLSKDINPASAEIFGILELKSADLELLRRIIMKVAGINVPPQEMEFFNLLDKIREIFDDIRDYREDMTLKNFNTLIYLHKEYKSFEQAGEVLEKFIEQETARCLLLVNKIEKNRRKRFLTICARLNEEKKYYLEILKQIPLSGPDQQSS